MAYSTILYDVHDGVATIWLNRPDRMNAFTLEMADELMDALDRADHDDQVRSVVFSGKGRAFCAGMDLSPDRNVFGLDESIDPLGPDMDKNRDSGGIVTLRLFRMKKPLIAAVNGASVGVGSTLQLPMDVRIASEFAKFGFVFSQRGITLESCASWFLPRLVGIPQALEWSFTGEVFDAETARRAGLVKEAVPADKLMDRAYEIAARFGHNTSSMSVAINRQLIWRMMGATHPMEAHRAESRTMLHASMRDGKEGVASFLEKRDAVFEDKVSEGPPKGFDWHEEPSWE